MSCPDELTWSVYADGELRAEELRKAEMHLVSCRACRTQVMALRDEMSALTRAMKENADPAPERRLRAAPAPELSWGLPVAVAAVTAVLTVGGLLLEMRLPGVLDLLNPKNLIGVNDMVFDVIFTLRDRWPEYFEAAVSVAGMAAVSALGCAAVHALSRRVARSSMLPLLLMFVWASADVASALDMRLDQNTMVASGETISESLVCTGEIATIDGTVDGDLIVGVERFTLRGTVTGNLYAFGREIEIDGSVQGSIIVIGDQVTLDGTVQDSATMLGDRLNVEEDARIGRDVMLFGEGVRMAGGAARDVTFVGDWIEVRGKIERDLHVLGADRVALLGGALIGRDVRARLWGRDAEVEQVAGSTVAGEVTVTQESIVHEHYLEQYKKPSLYLTLLVAAAAAFVFGLLAYAFDPRLFEAELPNAGGFARGLGVGFIALLAGPVAILLLGMTVVGIPIAVLGAFIMISSIYSAYVLVCGLIGQAVLSPSGTGLGAFAPSMLVGVLIVSIVASVPFVGPAVRILVVLFGLGCLFERIRGLRALNLGDV